jgi:hypothetical protein
MAAMRGRWVRLLLIAAMITVPTVLAAAADAQRPRSRAANESGYSRAEAEAIAARLYRGILGREADPGGMAGAAAEIQRGNLPGQIDSMLQSPEFRQRQRDLNPTQLLDQFFQGMLGRRPDNSAVSGYLPQMRARQYAAVLMSIVDSDEFQANPGTQSRPSRSAQASAGPSRLEAALDCQALVIDRVRRDASGRVFLSFDRLPDISGGGRVVSGPAVDRFDRDRQVSYTCDGGNVSYAYADRRRPNGGDRKLQFPSGAVKNCQNAISRDTVFDAATLSASDSSTEYVIGLVGGTRYTCTMDRQRVVDVRKSR